MKQIIAFLVLAAMMAIPALSEAADVSPEISIVPTEWNSPAERQGRVEAFDYTSGNAVKTAYVYLPYGYDDAAETRYNILYFMHGGGGWAAQFYNRDYALNDILDHAIESGEIEPLIVVTPTFYPPDDSDTSVGNAATLVSIFNEEFLNDLMPAVEMHYRTYAAGGQREDLIASRDHRAFGGFSMGSVTTWYQFLTVLDEVRYFLPFSGDCWALGQMSGRNQPEETAAYLANYASNHAYGDAFYIYAMTGSDDIAYEAMHGQIEAMRQADAFHFGATPDASNISFGVLDGATHDYDFYRNYIFSALKTIWPQGSR